MWVIRWALGKPYWLVSILIAIVVIGIFSITRIPKDLFPDLHIPVVYVAQPYTGMSPEQMESFLVYNYEYHFLNLNNLERMESRSIQGLGMVKLVFHAGTDMSAALAEVVNYVNRARAYMPSGTVPPYVLRFDAGSAPVGQLVFEDPHHIYPIKALQDAALFKIRPIFSMVKGLMAPPPFGGSPRTIVIRVHPDAMRSYGLAPDRIVQALGQGNVIAPSGALLIGQRLLTVPSNATVVALEDLKHIEVGRIQGVPVFLGDIAEIADDQDEQFGIALAQGMPTIYVPVAKTAEASTLDIVSRVKNLLPKVRSVLPYGMDVHFVFDESERIKQALASLAQEGILGAFLSGLMILIFLRDWRSSMVVILSIPLAVLMALIGLWLSGMSLNMMTLGGLALAVGIMVDQSTVVIEHVHSSIKQRTSYLQAVVYGSNHTIEPNGVALVSILTVFVSVFFMQGTIHYLFIPLAIAVAYALTASYFLSISWVPLALSWLHQRKNVLSHGLEQGLFLRRHYEQILRSLFRYRVVLLLVYVLSSALAGIFLWPSLSESLFPHGEGGRLLIRLHTPAGSSLQRTGQRVQKVLEDINHDLRPGGITYSLAYVGTQSPSYPINAIYLWTSGSNEAVLNVQINPPHHWTNSQVEEYLRRVLHQHFPDVSFSFEAADLMQQILNLGARTPVEINVVGSNLATVQAITGQLEQRLGALKCLRDVQLEQLAQIPAIHVAINRTLAGVLDIPVSTISKSMAAATASSRLTLPNFWSDPESGISYRVQVQVPQADLSSVQEFERLPIAQTQTGPLYLGDVASIQERTVLGELDRINMQRVLTLQASYVGNDLAGVYARIQQTIKSVQIPQGYEIQIRGLYEPLNSMLESLKTGSMVAMMAIFLVLSGFFQSFRLAFCVLACLPGVFTGIAILLGLTGTSINIQSLIGSIMVEGVATANAILLIRFCSDLRRRGVSTYRSMLHGASSRIRPILMTSLAMLAGMLPMALGLGEGGAQAASLGRAVMGGLLGALPTTLLVLPFLFNMVQKGQPVPGFSLLNSECVPDDDHAH